MGYFKKGIDCESSGYGIGAHSYYRRIVELTVDELLSGIAELMDGEQKEKYLDSLKLTMTTRQTVDKIRLVKDLVPNELKANGWNPLGVLHSELSEGLHNQTDEACLESACLIRSSLIYLIQQLEHRKQERRAFTEDMERILAKRAAGDKKP